MLGKVPSFAPFNMLVNFFSGSFLSLTYLCKYSTSSGLRKFNFASVGSALPSFDNLISCPFSSSTSRALNLSFSIKLARANPLPDPAPPTNQRSCPSRLPLPRIMSFSNRKFINLFTLSSPCRWF